LKLLLTEVTDKTNPNCP